MKRLVKIMSKILLKDKDRDKIMDLEVPLHIKNSEFEKKSSN